MKLKLLDTWKKKYFLIGPLPSPPNFLIEFQRFYCISYSMYVSCIHYFKDFQFAEKLYKVVKILRISDLDYLIAMFF